MEDVKKEGIDNSTGDKTQVVAPKVKKHKIFGEYKDCIISYKQPNKENVDVFASVNGYVLECKQDVKVSVPVDIIAHLKQSTYEKFAYCDKTKKDITVPMRKFTVELI